jgi:hypothetical protein
MRDTCDDRTIAEDIAAVIVARRHKVTISRVVILQIPEITIDI